MGMNHDLQLAGVMAVVVTSLNKDWRMSTNPSRFQVSPYLKTIDNLPARTGSLPVIRAVQLLPSVLCKGLWKSLAANSAMVYWLHGRDPRDPNRVLTSPTAHLLIYQTWLVRLMLVCKLSLTDYPGILMIISPCIKGIMGYNSITLWILEDKELILTV